MVRNRLIVLRVPSGNIDNTQVVPAERAVEMHRLHYEYHPAISTTTLAVAEVYISIWPDGFRAHITMPGMIRPALQLRFEVAGRAAVPPGQAVR